MCCCKTPHKINECTDSYQKMGKWEGGQKKKIAEDKVNCLKQQIVETWSASSFHHLLILFTVDCCLLMAISLLKNIFNGRMDLMDQLASVFKLFCARKP